MKSSQEMFPTVNKLVNNPYIEEILLKRLDNNEIEMINLLTGKAKTVTKKIK